MPGFKNYLGLGTDYRFNILAERMYRLQITTSVICTSVMRRQESVIRTPLGLSYSLRIISFLVTDIP